MPRFYKGRNSNHLLQVKRRRDYKYHELIFTVISAASIYLTIQVLRALTLTPSPEISWIESVLARYMTKAGEPHMAAAKKVL
jgi:hypothetical protein